MEYEKLHTYFKLSLWVEVFGEIFCGHYYWYTSIESRAIWKFKNFRWKFIKNMCFFHFFSNKGKIFYVFKEKTNSKWKKKRFYSWALYYFKIILLFKNVLWITNMKPYGQQKIAHYICCAHWFYSILFI